MKLDFEFIKQMISGMPEFATIEKQIFSVAGFDEAVSVVENIRNTVFPCVLVENIQDGNISFASGFCNNAAVAVWVVCRAAQNSGNDRQTAFAAAFELSKKIMAKIIAANAKRNDRDTYIDFSRGVRYMPAGPLAGNAYGYEFVYNTKTEMELIDS
ncbi:MAG: hypothetical protein LBP63_01940 [Prevotellaceae bacterium]|jgi:hypothetical protein|nr:hypothetical protein [Prevotellaceae bacterium]